MIYAHKLIARPDRGRKSAAHFRQTNGSVETLANKKDVLLIRNIKKKKRIASSNALVLAGRMRVIKGALMPPHHAIRSR